MSPMPPAMAVSTASTATYSPASMHTQTFERQRLWASCATCTAASTASNAAYLPGSVDKVAEVAACVALIHLPNPGLPLSTGMFTQPWRPTTSGGSPRTLRQLDHVLLAVDDLERAAGQHLHDVACGSEETHVM